MSTSIQEKIKAEIRDIPNFPKEGILFKDITPILLNPSLVDELTTAMADQFKDTTIDAIAGIESRGYLFGILLAQKLKVPFIMIRKEGKLPGKTIKESYDLEYGSATIEMHDDAIVPGSNVLIHDDLLATGGTAIASAKLIQQKANVIGFSFLIELEFLNGLERLNKVSPLTKALIKY